MFSLIELALRFCVHNLSFNNIVIFIHNKSDKKIEFKFPLKKNIKLAILQLKEKNDTF